MRDSPGVIRHPVRLPCQHVHEYEPRSARGEDITDLRVPEDKLN